MTKDEWIEKAKSNLDILNNIESITEFSNADYYNIIDSLKAGIDLIIELSETTPPC